jgi:hypothetical protein
VDIARPGVSEEKSVLSEYRLIPSSSPRTQSECVAIAKMLTCCFREQGDLHGEFSHLPTDLPTPSSGHPNARWSYGMIV